MKKEHLLWLEKHLKEVYNSSILENFLGLEVVELSEGKVIYKAKVAELHCNMYGNIHGGTFASIADVAMGVSCISMGKRVVTIDMSISYIKNATKGTILTAVGEVISNGKTIMRAVGKIYDENQQLLIRAQASYFVNGLYTESDYKK